MNNFFSNLHDDCKLKEFTNFFENFKLDSPSAMFLLYTKVSTEFIRNQKDFQTLEDSFKKKITEFRDIDSSLLSNLINKMIQRVIQNSYRGLPTLAIAHALHLKASSVDISRFKETDKKEITKSLEDSVNKLFNEKFGNL